MQSCAIRRRRLWFDRVDAEKNDIAIGDNFIDGVRRPATRIRGCGQPNLQCVLAVLGDPEIPLSRARSAIQLMERAFPGVIVGTLGYRLGLALPFQIPPES